MLLSLQNFVRSVIAALPRLDRLVIFSQHVSLSTQFNLIDLFVAITFVFFKFRYNPTSALLFFACLSIFTSSSFNFAIKVVSSAYYVLWHSHLVRYVPHDTVINTIERLIVINEAHVHWLLVFLRNLNYPSQVCYLVSRPSSFPESSMFYRHFSLHGYQWRSVTFSTGYSLLKKRVGQGVARWGLMKVGGYRKIKRTSY